MSETTFDMPRLVAALGLGAIGGLALGRLGYEHMFVVGLTEKERRTMMGLAVGAGSVYIVATVFGIDRKWWDLGAAAAAAETELTKRLAGTR